MRKLAAMAIGKPFAELPTVRATRRRRSSRSSASTSSTAAIRTIAHAGRQTVGAARRRAAERSLRRRRQPLPLRPRRSELVRDAPRRRGQAGDGLPSQRRRRRRSGHVDRTAAGRSRRFRRARATARELCRELHDADRQGHGRGRRRDAHRPARRAAAVPAQARSVRPTSPSMRSAPRSASSSVGGQGHRRSKSSRAGARCRARATKARCRRCYSCARRAPRPRRGAGATLRPARAIAFRDGRSSRPSRRPTSIWTARSPAGQTSPRPSANNR